MCGSGTQKRERGKKENEGVIVCSDGRRSHLALTHSHVTRSLISSSCRNLASCSFVSCLPLCETHCLCLTCRTSSSFLLSPSRTTCTSFVPADRSPHSTPLVFSFHSLVVLPFLSRLLSSFLSCLITSHFDRSSQVK